MSAATSEPRIADYAAIGNLRTVALVHREGSIDWLCWPRFDSGWLFSRLIDPGRGGFFELRPVGGFEAHRRYLPGTCVLETTFETSSGRLRLIDGMPWTAAGDRLVRQVECLSGEVELRVRLRVSPSAECSAVRFEGDAAPLTGAEETRLHLRAGERRHLGLRLSGASADAGPEDPERALAETISAWRKWSGRIDGGLAGPYRALVERSALVLKLLTYEPTSAIVAAPTTSLPEAIGGARNWDYRYVWLRDAALLLDALQSLGHHDEAMGFWRFLERLELDRQPARVLYTVDGGSPPPERELEAAGHRGSRPVRVGNAAVDQLQLDVYGHVLDAGWTCQTTMGEVHPNLRPTLGAFADAAATRWCEPDAGLWESRSTLRHHVYSKLYCWVGLGRALDLAQRGWLEGDVARWRAERAAIREAILLHGFDVHRGSYVQAFDRPVLDASVLWLGLTGCVSFDDPRMRATLDAVGHGLLDRGLVRRYVADDGFAGHEGAFLPCSLWYASALARAGRLDEAHAVFARVAACANDVGLLSEEADPGSGELLGNFPQAYTHLAVIQTALTLERCARAPAAHPPAR